MFQENLLLILSLLFAVFMLILIGQKLKISYPIFLVLAGLGISFVPGIPRVEVEPEVIFLIFLPPLLYEAAWYTSWNDFWKWRRPIGMLAFGLVFFTSVIVAYVSSAMIPGFTLALGFLLGGIISPPDAVAATSVLKNVNIPGRFTATLEGESLINDASSLIVFRFAVAAVISGHFSFGDAVGQFFVTAGMGVVVGLVIAQLIYIIHRFLPTTSSIDAGLTLMTPYFMYMAAEHFHYSGVMAVVVGGLFLSYRSHEILSNDSRIQSTGAWDTLVFVFNGLVFILIGLELPVIIGNLGDNTILEGIKYGVIISFLAIIVRILYVFLIAFVPTWFGNKSRMDTQNPLWKGPLIVGWAGMRGVVSLASALSIPFVLKSGQPFPYRNLILLITFIVILITLVFQGLTLPLLIKWVNIKDTDDFPREEEQEAAIRLRMMEIALEKLNKKYPSEITDNELVASLKNELESEISVIGQRLETLESDTKSEEKDKAQVEVYHNILLDLYEEQRKELIRLRKSKTFNDLEIRKQQRQIDFDEAKINPSVR